ncbi:MAG: hypothetical protein IJJ33_20855, partial [Victivallales bacterium]|nr:hypothetical protein [Victivallales bacterium]
MGEMRVGGEGGSGTDAALNSNAPKLHAAKAIRCFRYWEFWSLGDEMGEMRVGGEGGSGTDAALNSN